MSKQQKEEKIGMDDIIAFALIAIFCFTALFMFYNVVNETTLLECYNDFSYSEKLYLCNEFE